MKQNKASLILYADHIYDGKHKNPFPGYLAISEKQVIGIGPRNESTQWIGPKTQILELGNQTLCPGFTDTHTFFLGYALQNIGIDLNAFTDLEQILSALHDVEEALYPTAPLLGRNWRNNRFPIVSAETLDQAFPNRAVILFSSDRETCWMNTKAMREYHFTPDDCSPEACWRLIQTAIEMEMITETQFVAYMKMLNSRGITSVKEMGFDDYYGFTDTLKKLEDTNQLTLRVSFMSQPVSAGIDLEFGKTMLDTFQHDFVRFSGFNLMTDGSISQSCGHLKKPYTSNPFSCCAQLIDYEQIERDVLAADQAGFRFSLHAQGDGAVQKAVDILEKCEKENNHLSRRHAITDLEFTDPDDLDRMGALGIMAEIYPQIMVFGSHATTIPMINKQIGSDRGQFYWNRRKMADSNIVISCATDLPLLLPDIPESIYHACGGLFPEGDEPFNPKNTLPISNLMEAWTINGQFNLSRENELGTLEPGKLADITVLNGNLFATSMESIRDLSVSLTLVDGKIVYAN